MQKDSLRKEVLSKYKSRRRTYHIYRAAARLWGSGVPWTEALSVINEAFDACIAE